MRQLIYINMQIQVYIYYVYIYCICITGACEGSRIASIFEEPSFGFQSHPFGSRGVFFFKIGVCFYEGPPKRSSCRDSNESHVYNYIHTHLYIYIYT